MGEVSLVQKAVFHLNAANIHHLEFKKNSKPRDVRKDFPILMQRRRRFVLVAVTKPRTESW
ncbi:hypothetical protein CH361_18510 [Leptospira brenneri]|nr:hypothetical protein CH361_18510 [Leptospira brenneri]